MKMMNGNAYVISLHLLFFFLLLLPCSSVLRLTISQCRNSALGHLAQRLALPSLESTLSRPTGKAVPLPQLQSNACSPVKVKVVVLLPQRAVRAGALLKRYMDKGM